VVHSSSWFDDPNEKCQTFAWLVTIGDADPSYENTLAFVSKLRKSGAVPLLRSYVGVGHSRSSELPIIDLAFLKFYDDLTRAKLGVKESLVKPKLLPLIPSEQMPFVGDTQRFEYVKNTPEALEEIAEDVRVYLPSEEIAKIWGTREEVEK
jgi:hypothetical protein